MAVLFALVGVGALAGWLTSTDFQHRAVPLVEALLEDQTGEEVSLNAVRVRMWPPSLSVEGLHLSHHQTGDTIFSVERVRVPLVLRGGGPAIGRMTLQAPTVHLHVDQGTGLRELRNMKRKPPEERKPLRRLPWWSVDITDGSFRLDYPDGRVEIDRLELHPDASGRGELNARLQASARDLDIETQLSWPQVRVGPDTVEVPNLRVHTEPLQLQGSVFAALGGSVDTHVSAAVDLERLDPLLTPPRRLHGHADVDVSINGPVNEPRAAVLVAGHQVGIDVPGVFTPLLTYELGDLHASAHMDRSGITVEEAVLRWGGGSIVARAKVLPDRSVRDIVVSADDVHVLPLLQAFDVAPTPWVDMSTDVEINASGSLQPLRIEGSFDLMVADLLVGDRPIGRAGLEPMLSIPAAQAKGTLVLEKDHVFVSAPTVVGPRSRGSVNVDIGFGPRGPLDLSVDLHHGDLRDFGPLRGVALTGQGAVSARIWGPFNRLQLLGQGELTGFSALGVPYADRLVATIRSPELKSLFLDDAEAWVGASHYQGSYSMDFRPPLSMTTDIVIDRGRAEDLIGMFVDLDGVQSDLEGTLRLHGPINDMDGEAHLQLADVSLWGERFATGQAHGYLDKGRFTLDDLRVRRDNAGLTLRGSVERAWALDMELVADGLELNNFDIVKARQLPLEGRATAWARITNTLFDPSPSGRIAVTDVRYAGTDIPDSRVDFATDQGVAHYQGALIGGHAVVDGTVGLWREQPYALTVRLEHLPAHLFYPTAADGQPVRAIASGDVALSGHFGEVWSPVTMRASIADVELAWGHHLLRNKQPWLLEQDGPRTRLQGVSLEGGITDVQLSVQTGDATLIAGEGTLDLDLLRAVVPGVQRSTGSANVVLYAVGAKPNLQAAVEIDVDAQLFRMDAMPVSFEDTRVTLRAQEDRIEVLSLDGGVGGGRITGSGVIDAVQWRPVRYGLSLDVDGAQVRWVDALPPAIGRAKLFFDGPSDALLLHGTVDVDEMVFDERIDWEDWVVSYRDEMLVDPASMSEDQAMFNLNVAITAADTIRLRNNVAEGSARADLRIIGDTVRPGLVGRVEVYDAVAFLQDREFRVDRGVLLFNDPWTWDPELDISLLTEVRNQQQRFDIDYQVVGPFSAWRTNTRSDPPLPQADVNALLWFGMTTDQLEQMGELSTAVFQGVADLMLTDFFVSGQAGELSQGLPDLLFDRIDIATGVTARGDYSPDPRLVVEKRLDDEFEIDLSWQTNLVRPEDTYISIDRRIGGIWSLSGWYATLQRDRVLPIGGAYGVDVTARWEIE
jgi:hypothetical protein